MTPKCGPAAPWVRARSRVAHRGGTPGERVRAGCDRELRLIAASALARPTGEVPFKLRPAYPMTRSDHCLSTARGGRWNVLLQDGGAAGAVSCVWSASITGNTMSTGRWVGRTLRTTCARIAAGRRSPIRRAATRVSRTSRGLSAAGCDRAGVTDPRRSRPCPAVRQRPLAPAWPRPVRHCAAIAAMEVRRPRPGPVTEPLAERRMR